MKRLVIFAAMLLLAPAVMHAAVYTIYDGAAGDIGGANTDLDAFDATQDLTDSTAGYTMIENVAPVTPFNDGNAMVQKNMTTTDKPELQGDTYGLTGGTLKSAWRFDFQSYNNSSNYNDSQAIRWRMGNTGKSITSESRVIMSLSWQSDGKITAKYSDPGDGTTDVDTKSTSTINENLYKVVDVTIIGNSKVSGTYTYTLPGQGHRILNPQSYDCWIDDGTGLYLLNSGTDPKYANGMAFHVGKAGSNYDPALGLGRFGFVGSADSATGTQVMYDNIFLKTGVDVPEPATFGLLGIAGAAMLAIRRIRRK